MVVERIAGREASQEQGTTDLMVEHMEQPFRDTQGLIVHNGDNIHSSDTYDSYYCSPL